MILLSYRPGAEEAGPEKSFDLSSMALGQRWCAGKLDFEYADGQPCGGDFAIVRRPGRLS
jgi:NTE family protein